MKYIFWLLCSLLILPVCGQNQTQITVCLHKTPLKIHAEDALSALGIAYGTNNGIIYYIDRNCDLYGQISLGDRLIYTDGVTPALAVQRNINFGSVNTVARLTIVTRNGIQCMICHRHPVAWFSPDMQSILMSTYRR